jgi:hypothetical protein
MKRFNFIVVTIALLSVLSMPLVAAERERTFVIRRPTVIAFFPPVSEQELSDAGRNDSLAHFQYSANEVRKPLHAAGITFIENYAESFRIRFGKAVTTFHPEKIKVGYYLIAPGKQPRIEYGVQTEDDLLKIAGEYFGTNVK